jgi:hypothetical protein
MERKKPVKQVALLTAMLVSVVEFYTLVASNPSGFLLRNEYKMLCMKSHIIIISAFFAIACTNNNNRIIKFTPDEVASLSLDSTRRITVDSDSGITINLNPFLNEKTYNFGKMMKSIYVIPLETTDESLLSTIKNIVVSDSNIYIHDEYKSGGIVIFDNKGNFVKRIQQGQGPGEIFSLKHIAFDAGNNELVVFYNHFFSFFTPDGKFKRRERIPLNAYSFAILPDGYLFHSINGLINNHINPDIEYLILITDRQYKLRSAGFPSSYAEDNCYEGLTRYINLNENTINLTFKFTNFIYKYVDNFNIKLKYILDISRKGMPNSLLKYSYEHLMSELEENDYYFYMGDYVENATHDFFRFMNLYTRSYTFIYRDKQSGNTTGGTHKEIDPTMFIPLNEPISSYGKYFVSYSFQSEEWSMWLTSKFFPEDVVRKLKTLTEDDNPVLVFYELKNF